MKLHFRYMMKSVFFIFHFSFVFLFLSSCSQNESVSEYDIVKSTFFDNINGGISDMQFWKTSVTLNVDVQTKSPVKLWLLSNTSGGGTLYDFAEAKQSGSVCLTAPQGVGNTVYIVTECKKEIRATTVVLSGRGDETIMLDMEKVNAAKGDLGLLRENDVEMLARKQVRRNASTASSLYGQSILGNAEHYEFTEQQMQDYYSMMDLMTKESVNAKTENHLNVDYELESNGPFNITWVAGNCMSVYSNVLGYYYHSPGTYSDIKYVDICETEVYDYIDGLAKVQYKVNEAAATEYDILPDTWYDANFDIDDCWDVGAKVTARKDDDCWNTMAVYNRYHKNITSIRGITFTVDVPKGKRVGFYNRENTKPRPEQYDRLVKKGVPPYTTRDKFMGTSYSAEGMNIINAKGNFRSFIYPMENIMWMGMEDITDGGDLDCNDVIFGVTAEMDIYKPSIEEPDLKPEAEFDDKMPWTLAFEDAIRQGDFDFNDAVIKIAPDYEKHECNVKVLAAGSTYRMYLHYDGPNGDVNLGEIHELLNKNANGGDLTKINTTNSVATVRFADIGNVSWPSGYTIANDAKRFYIEVQRGSCKDCGDILCLPESPGEMPEAILVAGDWKWPMEGISIFSVYNNFSNWAKDVTNVSYWGWYSFPKNDSYVSY